MSSPAKPPPPRSSPPLQNEEAQRPSPSLPPPVPVASTSALPPSSPPPVADELDKEYPPDAIVTYRHLLSPQSLTPSNPLRVIGHCDVDAAYAQFEGVRLGLDKTVPIAVQQWQGLIAINYPARAFGITRHMNVSLSSLTISPFPHFFSPAESYLVCQIMEARKRCPELIACHVATLKDGEDEPKYHENPQITTHKVSLEPYRKESQKIIKIFQRCVPEGEIEKASIDEAYLDLSLPIRNLLLTRYPHLSILPPNSPLGLDTPLPPAPKLDWESSEWGIPPSPISPPPKDPSSDSEEGGGGREGNGWSDVALWLGGEVMERVRGEVEKELGYTTSAGISHNKILAKVCSAYKKPRAQTVLRTSAVSRFLRPMAFQKIRFLGGKLGDAIANEYGAATVGDLLSVSLEEMQRKFGEESLWVYNILRGIDHSEVKEKSLAKSMLASKNMRPPLTALEQGQPWLRVLCVELVGRLKEARGETSDGETGEQGSGVWPKTLVLSWREADLHHNNAGSSNKSKQLPFPFHRPLSPDGPILKIATRLLGEILASNSSLKPGTKPIRIINLALGFTGLERGEEGQRGIEGFLRSGASTSAKVGKRKEVELDEERNAVAGSSTPSTSSSSKKLKNDRPRPSSDDNDDDEEVSISDATWTCPDCSKILPIPSHSELDRVKGEHQDWHIAKALQEETVGSVASSSSSGSKREGIGKKSTTTLNKKKKSNAKENVGGLGGWLLKK
ncbi:hypothetical protein BDY24DRAFT_408629 [Mrakia frigida]|uniref:uncharacterized protein n=1 Tax=Mrakia frigida TaxID=29902 RepID=UPI003FCC2536